MPMPDNESKTERRKVKCHRLGSDVNNRHETFHAATSPA
jgi:hypothetical protein